MTIRQQFLKTVYPIWMWLNKNNKRNNEVLRNKEVPPPVSFYSLKAVNGYGLLFDFSVLKGKKVMIVNTASDCGYTGQYEELEKIHRQYKDGLAILAFPTNDFGGQEKGTDAEIAEFCSHNYHISFPVMSKTTVHVSAEQTPVYHWLTNALSNGWNSKAPSWNFAKYLIDEEGKLVNYFGPSISPASKQVIEAVEKS
ncbi:MAG: glutathione peroxidase [Bacteroidota bacterium]